MSEAAGLSIVAHIHNDYREKFGVPRQSGLVAEVISAVVLCPEYRLEGVFRGIEGFSHLWLLWQFSENLNEGWSPTVRPPRLGGNKRVGVFASRSPFRPSPVGLSAVRLLAVQRDKAWGEYLLVAGADLLDGTPIYDIKPYVPYADAIPDAAGGFAVPGGVGRLHVVFPPDLLAHIPEAKRAALLAVLAEDPRPAYQEDAARVYGLNFAGYNVRFRVAGDTLTVCAVAENS